MAIIKCPECRREVSSKAPVCPYCGVIINKEVYHSKNVLPKEELFTEEEEDDEEEQTPTPAQKKNTEPQNPKNYKWLFIIIAILAIAVCATVGYYMYMKNQQEEAKLEQILASEDPDEMQNYLDLHPDMPATQRKVIEGKISRALQIKEEWINACDTESVIALKSFLRKHPTNIHAEEARIKIDSLDFITAKRSNSIEAYQTYMDQHRDGDYYDIASNMVSRLEKSSVTDDEIRYIHQAFKNYFDNLKTDNDANSEFDDVISVKYSINNDYKVTKVPELDGNNTYKATFTVNKQVNRSSDAMAPVKTYKVQGTINSKGNVENVNMEEII